jgi:hypothetical protein
MAAKKLRSDGLDQGRNYTWHREVTSEPSEVIKDTLALPDFGVEWTLSSLLVIIRDFFSNSPACSRILCMKEYCVNAMRGLRKRNMIHFSEICFAFK